MRGPCITGRQHSIVFVFLLGFAVLDSALGLKCLSCDRAKNINECLTTTATCKDGEESCFLDETRLSDLSVVYTAGCRANMICTLMAPASGKRSLSNGLSRERKDSVSCAACCKTQANSTGIPCNGYLCNQAPTPIGNKCAVCSNVFDPKHCLFHEQCPSNEVCFQKVYVEGGTPTYRLGCERKLMCDAMRDLYIQSHAKRQNGIQICSACCEGNSCNTGNCIQLRKRQPRFENPPIVVG